MSAETSSAVEKQTRIQSPSYPSLSLREAIAAVGKIEARYRGSIVDRNDAVKLVGYAGLTGPANMALAALALYGLVDRAGKGEIRVTERARSILHPASEREKRLAIVEAGLSPPLYKDLRERFSDVGTPPEDGVITYLNRLAFNPTAVRPAARAFLQTVAYLQEVGAMESSGHSAPAAQESASAPKREEPRPMQTTAHPHHPTAAPHMAAGELVLNEPNLSIRGGTVRVEALLDFDGLSDLENQIKALRMILKPRQPVAPASVATPQTDSSE